MCIHPYTFLLSCLLGELEASPIGEQSEPVIGGTWGGGEEGLGLGDKAMEFL
jgi:hypothetical protein